MALEADKFTKLFQMAAAALALPAAAAGAYTVYRTNFSPDVACQNLRASIVATMEKNVAADAKRALLKKDVSDFEKNCGEVDPEARALFQAAIEDRKGGKGASDAAAAKPAASRDMAAPAAVAVLPRPDPERAMPQGEAAPTPASSAMTPSATPSAAASAPMVPAPTAPAPTASPPPTSPPVVSAMAPPPTSTVLPSASPPPSPAPAQVLPRPAAAAAPTSAPLPAPGTAAPVRPVPPPSAKTAAREIKPVPSASATADSAGKKGWVVLAARLGPRRGEINFEGFPIRPGAHPPPGTVLKARWAVPLWSDSAMVARDPAAAQTVLQTGSCVRVLSTRPGAERIWAEVQPTRC